MLNENALGNAQLAGPWLWLGATPVRLRFGPLIIKKEQGLIND